MATLYGLAGGTATCSTTTMERVQDRLPLSDIILVCPHGLQFIDHNIMYAVMGQWDGWQILTMNLYTHLTILWYSAVGCSLPENTTKYL